MEIEQRNAINAHLEAVHKLLLEASSVRGGDWNYKGTLADGRPVTHKFRLDGYVRRLPPEHKCKRCGNHCAAFEVDGCAECDPRLVTNTGEH